MTPKDTEAANELQILVGDFPTSPGVYLMKDDKGDVIYIGKAKSLRARVRSYLGGGDGRVQVPFLMRRVRNIEKIVTETEQQAFLLERDLITKHKPRYNIRLKDDKAYLSIRIDPDEEWPRVTLVRKVEQDGAQYFGPYTFSYELRTLLELIHLVIPLRTCNDTVFFNRARPCLEYQIKRCAGPCCLPVDRKQYGLWIKQAIAILQGKTDLIEKELSESMDRASENLRFEDAALMRDRIELLKNFRGTAHLVSSKGEDRDVFALYREERLATVAVLQVRRGRVADSVNFSFPLVEISDEDLVEACLSQFYDAGRTIPQEIILQLAPANLSMVKTRLREKRGSAVTITIPKRGVAARLLGLGQLNAQEHFRSTFDAESRYLETATALAKLFRLSQIPRRVEAVDISNFQGSDIVGAIVAFSDGAPDKSSYKRYNISRQGKPDDFASIYEVVSRRLARGREEDNLPDLLVVDGGPGQLAMALKAREESGVALEIVSLAKEKVEPGAQQTQIARTGERVYLLPDQDPIVLDMAASSTKFLQQIRDEVHRFVIGFHRKRRSKRVFSSVLDEVSGLGPERRKRLLARFGSVENMKSVAVEDLATAGRMPVSLAGKVLERIRKS